MRVVQLIAALSCWLRRSLLVCFVALGVSNHVELREPQKELHESDRSRCAGGGYETLALEPKNIN